MKRSLPMSLLTCVVVAVSGEHASAQIPIGGPGGGAPYRPAYSPYLNLLRQGGSSTQNYFGLVRPELNFTDSVNGLQQQVGTNQQNINQLQANSVTTGHLAIFMNLGGYFQSMRGGNAGGQGLAAGFAPGVGSAGVFGQGMGNVGGQGMGNLGGPLPGVPGGGARPTR